MKNYNRSNIQLARNLRKNMTPWERKLWYEYLNQYPLRFQRQKAIGDYIVDFYCAKAQLVIELDGGGHYDDKQILADQQRTKALEAMGLRIIRICNLDIDKNFMGVCEFIDMQAQQSLPQSASLTAPSSEGALQAPRRIFALGFFDGVHLGHQALLKQSLSLAQIHSAQAAVITFDRHPMSLFTPQSPALVNTAADRERLLKQFGIQYIHSIPVTKEVMSTSWQNFLAELQDLGAVGFVCGNDFRFGHRGEGDAEKLQAYCAQQQLPCIVVPEQTVDGIRISSSHIRSLLEQGKVEEANRFLGHPHIFTGTVVPGRQLGRTIGIPTANLHLPEDVLIPKFGVYACIACFDGKKLPAVTNIGTRPTVNGHHITVEPWILDFSGDLYGQEITLEFHHFLRPEQKFASLEELQQEILNNAQQTRNLLDFCKKVGK